MLAMTYDTATKIFNGYVEVADENNVPENATLVKPNGIVQPYTWDGSKWIGESVDDYQTEHQSTVNTSNVPTVEQKQLSELIKNNAKQSALNAQLIKQVAELKAQLVASTTSTKQEAE